MSESLSGPPRLRRRTPTRSVPGPAGRLLSMNLPLLRAGAGLRAMAEEVSLVLGMKALVLLK